VLNLDFAVKQETKTQFKRRKEKGEYSFLLTLWIYSKAKKSINQNFNKNKAIILIALDKLITFAS